MGSRILLTNVRITWRLIMSFFQFVRIYWLLGFIGALLTPGSTVTSIVVGSIAAILWGLLMGVFLLHMANNPSEYGSATIVIPFLLGTMAASVVLAVIVGLKWRGFVVTFK